MLKKVFTYLILSLTIFTNSQSFVFSQIYNWTKTEISADWKNTSFYIFPDSWSKEKIKKEIGEAYGNIIPKTVTRNWRTEILYRWKTSDGTSIQFYKDANWNIESAFPNFQSDFNNLFN